MVTPPFPPVATLWGSAFQLPGRFAWLATALAQPPQAVCNIPRPLLHTSTLTQPTSPIVSQMFLISTLPHTPYIFAAMHIYSAFILAFALASIMLLYPK